MSLNNLKPAWRQFRLYNSMQSLDQEEMLWLLERVERLTTNKTNRFLVNAIMFIVLTICCQGG